MAKPVFKKAEKKHIKLRMALLGPAGSGKTYTALAIASNLDGPVAVIDTEHGSASKYGDLFAFDVLELESFAPSEYVSAIRAAEAAGYKTLVIDSLSHAWIGKGGALEMVDHIAKRSDSRNTFAAWRDVTPQHNSLVEAMLAARMNIIVTLRVKMEYVIEENERGKKTPRKVGLQPQQRDGLEYEFDVVGDLNLSNELVVGKTRCPALTGKIYPKAGSDIAAELTKWLGSGRPTESTTERGDAWEPPTQAELSYIRDEICQASNGLRPEQEEYAQKKLGEAGDNMANLQSLLAWCKRMSERNAAQANGAAS